jgi:hypothetical protein
MFLKQILRPFELRDCLKLRDFLICNIDGLELDVLRPSFKVVQELPTSLIN